ncbi:extensin family protein [Phytoactinopolyspora halotolerans]|uniref:Extensin family protein n=1 Tax=Phytoactinopolyspora halotolerans TaxID=1981512 RepID=A0A6L9SDU0_9ACTN|nr:extensin family protein [Phytoactinopolyspora halotolerans]NEE03199.1 extensin family protein [Phytoactinopolyspora halotolerans]
MSGSEEFIRPAMSRRNLLLAGTAGVAGAAGLIHSSQALAAGPSAPPGGTSAPPAPSEPLDLEPSEVSAMALITRDYLGTTGCKLYYEPSGNPNSFTFNDTFYNQLSSWKNFIYNNAPDSWGWPSRIYSYGAYVDKPGMHGSGRAFDIGKIVYKNSSGTTHTISMRYDVWHGGSNAALYRRRYWGAAASFARRFRHVITYADNSTHHNHIHADNAIYGSTTDCYYSTGSTSQTYIVQGCCRVVWGLGTALDGDYGPETERHSTQVLRRIGRSSGNITNKYNFRAFLTASFRKAVGTQSY